MNPSDELTTHFESVANTLKNGRVTWGYIVQANMLMFKKGSDNCPGEMVYSLVDSNPSDLQRIAGNLFSLKGTRPNDPELLPIAEYLTDEYIRVYGLNVPNVISQSLPCKISTTYFVRKHLPGGRIYKPLMPLVVNPDLPSVVTPLPGKYWPDELIDWWLDE